MMAKKTFYFPENDVNTVIEKFNIYTRLNILHLRRAKRRKTAGVRAGLSGRRKTLLNASMK